MLSQARSEDQLKGFPNMRKKDDGGGNQNVPAALITALLAAGLAGPKAIDLKSGDETKPDKAVEHTSFGSPTVMLPSSEVVSWARRQLSSLASDDQA
jgi:hypothetical protein